MNLQNTSSCPLICYSAMILVNLYCILFSIVGTSSASSFSNSRVASRQISGCGSDPVDCGEEWCCYFGEKCQVDTNSTFICVEAATTNAYG